MSFADELTAAKQEYNVGGSDIFKFAEGDNEIRVLADAKAIATHFRGKNTKPAVCYGADKGCPFHTDKDPKPSVKFFTWVIDRKDGNLIKAAYLPYTVTQAIAKLQKSKYYAFENCPMPYDITVNATDAGTMDVEYAVIASPEKKPLTEEELQKFSKLDAPKEVVEKAKATEALGGDEVSSEGLAA